MKSIIAISVAALIAASAVHVAYAQNGAICLFADPAGTDCNLTDDGPGLLSIYVVHSLTPGAMASQFWAPKPSCMVGATWLSDAKPFPVTIGNSQTGVAIGYGTCLASPIHILTMNYQTTGATQNDCAYSIRPHPNVTNVEAVDCDENVVFPGAGKTYLNSDLDCVCAEDVPPELGYSPSMLDFYDETEALSITVVNLGGGNLTWSVFDAQGWIEVNPSGGENNGTVIVSVDRDNVFPGEATGAVFLTSNGGNATIPVRMDVIAQLWVSTTVMDFGTSSTQSSLAIQNVGDGIMSWNLSTEDSWIALSPTSGQNSAYVTVTVDRTGMSNGTHTGHIQITSDGGNATITVTMAVGPALSIDPDRLDFGYYTTVRYFDIENTGAGTLTWALTTDTPWITIDPTSGENGATIEVAADRSGLPNGFHQGAIIVHSNGGELSLQVTIEVGPSLYITPTTLTFSGATTEATFSLRNIGEGTLEWNLAPDSAWISAAPTSGTDDATIHVTVERCALKLVSLHQGSIVVTSNGGDGSVLVRAYVMDRLIASPNYFEFVENELETGTFQVTTPCTEPLDWAVTAYAPWITVSPDSGSGQHDVTITVEWPEGVEDGEIWGGIEVTEVGGLGQATVAVRFLKGDILVPAEKKSWGSLKSKFKN